MSYRQLPSPISPRVASRIPTSAQPSRIGRPKSIRLSAGSVRSMHGQVQQSSRVPKGGNPSLGVRTSIRMVRPVGRTSEGNEVLEHRFSPSRGPATGQLSKTIGKASTGLGRVSTGGRLSSGPAGRVSTSTPRMASENRRLSTDALQHARDTTATGVSTTARIPTGVGKLLSSEKRTPLQTRPGSLRYPSNREGRVTSASARRTEVRRAPVVDSPMYGNAAGRIKSRYSESSRARRVSGGAGMRSGYSGVRSTPGLPKTPTMLGVTPSIGARGRLGLGRVKGSDGVDAGHRVTMLPDRGAEEAVMSPAAAIGLSSAGRRSSGARLTASRVASTTSAPESPYGKGTRVRTVRRVSFDTSQSTSKDMKHGSGWKERLASASEILRMARRNSFTDLPPADEPREMIPRRRSRSSIGVMESAIVNTNNSASRPSSQNNSPSTPSPRLGKAADPQEPTSLSIHNTISNSEVQDCETPGVKKESNATRLSTSARRRSSRFGDGKVSLKNIDRLSLTIGRRRSRGTSMTKEDLLNAPTPVVRSSRTTKLLDLTPKTPSSTQSTQSTQSSSSSEQEVLSVKKLSFAPLSSPNPPSNARISITSKTTLSRTSAHGKENSVQGLLSDDLSWVDQDGGSNKLLTSPDGKKDNIDDLDEDLRWTALKDHNSALFSR